MEIAGKIPGLMVKAGISGSMEIAGILTNNHQGNMLAGTKNMRPGMLGNIRDKNLDIPVVVRLTDFPQKIPRYTTLRHPRRISMIASRMVILTIRRI